MGIIEDVGEGTLRLVSRIYHNIAAVARMSRKIKIYRFFERRGIDYKDYTVLKAQLAALLFLFSSVLYVFELLPWKGYALLSLGGGYPLILLPTLRKLYPEDYRAYRDFFSGYLVVALFLVMLKTLVPMSHSFFPNIHLVVFSLLYITAFSYFFKKKYGRHYTFGRVVKGGSPAEVKFNYDLRASVKPGIALLANEVGAEEGDVVVVEVDRAPFNLRGRKPLRILRVHRETGESIPK
jgi:uncharacterized membrane protein